MTSPNEPLGDQSGAPLSPERWGHVRALVEEALQLPREAWPAFLAASCDGDDVLRDLVARLAAACERSGESWGFLAQPASELLAPLLVANGMPTAGPPATFNAALADRYVVGAELGRGGMATVYGAEDLRHQRRVAIKVLDPHLGAMLGAERFLAEIRVTAGLQHPNLLPLFDSGEAGGLLYYVMPLIEGATLRARLYRERQLPVAEAVRIVSAVAGAVDYAHRQGVVHRDLKPENILVQEGQPLVADFGIALAVARAGGAHLTAPGISLGTPQYMSPEQAGSEDGVDGRSDIYSMACILYELLTGDPPFTGSTKHAIIAKVLADTPSSVRTVRPSVPAHIDAALARALSKLPADRQATAREFADALVGAPIPASTGRRATPVRWRTPMRFVLGAAAIVAVVIVWMASRKPAAPALTFVFSDIIEQTLGTTVTITPGGSALVYTGSADVDRRIMLRPLEQQRPERTLAGTEGGLFPLVAPDGRRLAFFSSDRRLKIISIDDGAVTDGAVSRILRRIFKKAEAWRYGNSAWVGDSVIVSGVGAPGLSKSDPRGGTSAVFTRVDTARGEAKHDAPLLLPGTRAVVFTVRNRYGPQVVSGPLAIASLDPGADSGPSHVLLGMTARRAIAFVDGWLLFIKADGTGIQAVRLDVKRRRISGNTISVLEDEAGNVETASLADNGTLLYVRRPRTNSAVFVDTSGAVRPASAEGSLMHPRISPDGKRFAVEITSEDGRTDVWVYDIATRTPMPLTTTGKARHPTWTPDGRRIVFMALGSRQLMSQPVDGGAAAEKILKTEGSFAPEVAPDGRSVVFQRGAPLAPGAKIWSASLTGEGAPRKVMDDPFDNYEPAVSPNGHWLAYTSNATGHPEVYARAFPGPGAAVQVSDGGGIEAAWSPDGGRIYYRAKRALMEAVVTTPALAITSRRQLFKGKYDASRQHRNYDVAPDGTGFLMIAQQSPDAVVVLHWLPALRARLASAR